AAGVRMVRQVLPILVDERAIDARRLRVRAEGVPGVHRARRIRSRGTTGQIFVEMTIEVDPRLDVGAAHDISDEVERAVIETFSAREVVVHIEPWRDGRRTSR